MHRRRPSQESIFRYHRSYLIFQKYLVHSGYEGSGFGFFLFCFVSCKLESCLLCSSVVSLTVFSFTCPEKIFSVEALTCVLPSLPCLLLTLPWEYLRCCSCQCSTSSCLSLTCYYSLGVWQVCLIISACSSSFLYYQSNLQPCPIRAPVSLPSRVWHCLPSRITMILLQSHWWNLLRLEKAFHASL